MTFQSMSAIGQTAIQAPDFQIIDTGLDRGMLTARPDMILTVFPYLVRRGQTAFPGEDGGIQQTLQGGKIAGDIHLASEVRAV